MNIWLSMEQQETVLNNILYFLATISFLFISAIATADTIDDRLSNDQREIFKEIESDLLSPFCPGRLLRDCPSTATRNLKEDIKTKILEGKTAEAVKEELIEKYGEDLRAAPPKSGIGLLAWYLPVVFLLLGLLLLVLFVRKQTKS